MATKRVKLDKIRIDGKTQQRSIDDATVDRYAILMEDGAEFPAIEAVYDGKDHWLWDGFQRYHAARKNKKKAVDVNVRKGTQRTAIWLSFSANACHGKPRTSAEGRMVVSKILDDPEWAKKSLRIIATHTGLSHETIRIAKKSRKQGTSDIPHPKASCQNLTPDSKDTEPTGSGNGDHSPDSKQAKDGAGNVIPEHLRLLFFKRKVINQLITKIDDIESEVKTLIENSDPVAQWINYQRFQSDMKNVKSTIKHAKPYAICPYCWAEDSDDCKACRGAGFVTKMIWDQAPELMKKGGK